MNQNEFERQQQAAVQRMREMNSRVVNKNNNYSMPPVPPFVRVQNNSPTVNKPIETPKINNPPQKEVKTNSFFGGLNIPFLDNIMKDGDMTLIVGLLLILISENADKRLIFALIYILL